MFELAVEEINRIDFTTAIGRVF